MIRPTRFTVVAVAIAIVREAPPLAGLLFGRPVREAVASPSFAVIDALIAIGAYAIGAGDPAVIENPSPRFGTRALATSAAFLLGCLVVSVAVTAIWRLIDRGRAYPSLDQWVRTVARYVLGVRLITYGMSKVIPNQFGVLRPGELLRPLGDLTGFDLLWTFMAASPGYTIFTGLVELLAGLLLFWRRTALPGALLAAACMANVIALDAAYDVGGPLLTAIVLFVLAGIVLLPHAGSLWRFLIASAGDDARLSPARHGFASLRVRRALNLTVLVCLLGMRVQTNVELRRDLFAGRPMYGLWDVEALVSAAPGAASQRDTSTNWRRVGTGGRSASNGLIVQFANFDVRHFDLDDDGVARTWRIRQRGKDVATLRYEPSPDGSVVLDGLLGDAPVTMRLRPVDPARYRLLDLR